MDFFIKFDKIRLIYVDILDTMNIFRLMGLILLLFSVFQQNVMGKSTKKDASSEVKGTKKVA